LLLGNGGGLRKPRRMSEALIAGRDFREGDDDDERPAGAQLYPAAKYDPDEEAYRPDPANDKRAELGRAIESGNIASVRLSVPTKDGRREQLELGAGEIREYYGAELPLRERFVNRKIAERRARTAAAGARKLIERNRGAYDRKLLTPDEDACLRETGALRTHTVLRESGEGYDAREVLTDRFSAFALRESALTTLKLLEDDDGFWDGGDYGGGAEGGFYGGNWYRREFLAPGGPAFRQQNISDIFDSCSKQYYAFTHDPVARQGCNIIASFVCGRGINIVAKDPKVQDVVDEFIDRTNFNLRIHKLIVQLSRDGELFIRKMPLGDGRMAFVSVPPETIWEIVTNGEDPNDVYYYVQRFQTRYQSYVQQPAPASTRYQMIERYLKADEMIHVKINNDESDVRGHSDIFPALGWLRRMRDYFDALVGKEQSAAAYVWHYKVNGSAADMQRIANAAVGGRYPEPGSYFMSNDKVDISAVASGTPAPTGSDSTYGGLLNHIATAFGLSKVYFGLSDKQARASALVATEPSAKKFEQRQDTGRFGLINPLFDAVAEEAQAHGVIPATANLALKALMPSIVKADAGNRLALLGQAEAMGAIAHETMANETAGELDLDDYDYGEETKLVEKEIGQPASDIIWKNYESIPRKLPQKGDVAFAPGFVPDPAASAAAGTPVDVHGNPPPPKPSALPTNGKPPALPSGADKSPLSTTGAASIRRDNGAREALRALHEAALAVPGAIVVVP
jgi:hypothetical protein